jgi:ABC-2 type transport system ATP-binding protein
VPVIEVEGLVKSYDGVPAVDGVSFTVEEGEIFGIVGPNGAGKTTTVESIEGLREPDAGTIRVLGLDPIRDRYEITERVGAQLQESRLQDRIRVGEVLELYASFYRNPVDRGELLERLGLGGKETARYSSLSGGQKQKLSVALALVGSPEIAVLDELTTGLDPQARRSAWDTIEQIRSDGVTVVLVTHFMEEAERLCDRVMVVARGRVVVIDTPGGLIGRLGSGTRLIFRPSAPVDDALLMDLPEVEQVERKGGRLVVDGGGNVVQSVTALLAARDVVAQELRVEQQTLEDAYLQLTGELPADAEDV